MDEDTKPQVLKDEYWTMDRVIRWLESQDFQRAIDIFKSESKKNKKNKKKK
jgi:hypothetical protein